MPECAPVTAASYVSAFAELFGPPPADAAPAPVPVDWDTVESWLGLRLPADYKAIASAYGPLDIGEFVWLHIPCARKGWFEYGSWLEGARGKAPDGLLPWGETRMCDLLYWDTTASDDPDEWPVVTFHKDGARAGADPWHRYSTPLLPTLTTLLGEGLRPTASRTAFLTEVDPGPWTPPVPPPAPTPQQRAALTEGTGLEALTALVPPPRKPYLGDGTWEWLYERLGTRLPTEYVTLMEAYGGGCWTQWLNFDAPLETGRFGLVEEATRVCDGYRSLRASHPQFQPLAVWPEPGGLLPFASSIDGDQLGWLTEGPTPDDWSLIVYPRHAEQGPPLTGTLTDTLLAWLRGRFGTEGLPSLGRVKDPLDHIGFEPLDDVE